MKWLQDVRWGRMTLVFPVLAFCLCFLCMVWAFIDGDRVGGSRAGRRACFHGARLRAGWNSGTVTCCGKKSIRAAFWSRETVLVP